MSSALFWPVVCLAVGLGLLVLEVFVPSGGIIGLLSIGFLVVGVALAFGQSTALGLKFLIAIGLLAPAAGALALYLWPRSPMAKYMFLKPPDADELGTAADLDNEAPRPEHLVGLLGLVASTLRPSGAVEIDGRRHEALAEEGMIDAGAIVRVLAVRSGRLIVRAAAATERPAFLDQSFELDDHDAPAGPAAKRPVS